MCIWTMENNWGTLKGQLKRDDILAISSLKELSDTQSSIREKLSYCKECGVRICLQGICLQEDIYMDFLSVMEREEQLRRDRVRTAQQQGIDQALERCRLGLGNYGRPRAEIPEDFDDQIRFLKQNHMSLEAYRKKTNLKKSTFYKYAKLVLE